MKVYVFPSAMSKVERLNARVAKLLSAAVQEVLEAVRETVSEYQEKTARTQRENERLRKRLQELQDRSNRSSGEKPASVYTRRSEIICDCSRSVVLQDGSILLVQAVIQ